MSWPAYQLFEYEKVLAQREIAALGGGELNRAIQPDRLGRRATYLHAVDDKPTAQAQAEQAHLRIRGSGRSRQATRFLVHGLHEYKGKFNPQLARALINTVDPSATMILDPFCGSGTTVVEAMRLGLHSVGIDQNPMARFIAGTKVAVMAEGGRALTYEFDSLRDEARNAIASDRDRDPRPPSWTTSQDQEYLANWFPPAVLSKLWALLGVVDGGTSTAVDLLKLTISTFVREVSWQLPEDLRIRRRRPGWSAPDVLALFDVAATRSLNALREVQTADLASLGEGRIELGSSQDARLVASALDGAHRRLVVTSPPYATALPYVDTDRLSMVLLGLASAKGLRPLEMGLTGSREWTKGESGQWEEARQANAFGMPTSVVDLLCRIDHQNSDTGAGFRRAAMPGLLYRYFAEMASAIRCVGHGLRAGERAVFVVGTNRTGPRDKQIDIATPALLGDVASDAGFRVDELLPLETWPRYGMHAKNAVDAEQALILTKV
jgi:site-specific DNA-methyltransferase (cytosine-N4-specific)